MCHGAFAKQHDTHHATLQYQLKKMPMEERVSLEKIGQLEAEKEAIVAKKKELETRKAERAVELNHDHSGAEKLYRNSGVTFAEYQTAHQWGTAQIVSKRMTPAEAARAV
eukprot:1360609-Rhodomonas_salina.1